jgi:casein kinase II subunit beta
VDFENISDDETGPQGWIKWFCTLDGHDFLVEVDEDFIKDKFNLYGLARKFKPERYEQCLKMILATYTPTSEDMANEEFMELN